MTSTGVGMTSSLRLVHARGSPSRQLCAAVASRSSRRAAFYKAESCSKQISPFSSTSSSSSSSSLPAHLAVLGAGQMGTGIALAAARQKVAMKVHVLDAFSDSLEKSKKFAEKWCSKEVEKSRLTEAEKEELLSEVLVFPQEGADYSAVGNCDFVIEAVSENLDLKHKLYKTLVTEFKLPASAVLASNTSSISITKLAAGVPENPERFVGMHFMNPVPVMPLVEIIRGLQTSDETHKRTLEMVSLMKKDPATSQDRPGFIANRVLMPYINEACFCLQEKIATREDIDKILKLGTNVPMGPLTLADFIGLDTCLAIMRVLHQELGDSKYRPSPLLVNYVEAGYLGKKSGRGFYDY